MKKIIGCLFILIISYPCFSQATNSPITFTVLDAESHEPVPYATIYSKNQGTGTVTNLDGQFQWPSSNPMDTLILSFVGYQSQTFIGVNTIPVTILLKPKTEVLASAFVYGDMTFLYALVANCKDVKSKRPITAKTYLSLESIINEQTVESMEAYYNGDFSGYDCQELKLKTGRLAISNFGNRFFISTETSKALYLHQLYGTSDHFPISPMGLNRKKLNKYFELQFVKSYKNESKQTIYQIEYTPTKDCLDCFYGTLWVDSLNKQIQKATLLTDSTQKHPFIPIGSSDRLLKVSLEITKNYQTGSNVQFKSTDFNYQLVYKTRKDSVFKVNTNALVYAYDYSTLFTLPHFKYGNIRYLDYILIGSLPYNGFFWQNYKEFKMANQKESELYRSLNPSQTGTFVNTHNPYFKKPFFEHSYKAWSMKRIQLNQALDKSVGRTVPLEAPPSQQYKLVTQIYMDVNEFNDSLDFKTRSYFDPYYSYFYLPQTQKTDAFVNMYFDLTEIKRRELEERLSKAQSKNQAEAIYAKCMDELTEQQKTFVKETQRGNNLKAMEKWNSIIFNNLQIDNVQLFKLTE